MLRAVAEAGYARVGFFPLDSKSSFPLLTLPPRCRRAHCASAGSVHETMCGKMPGVKPGATIAGTEIVYVALGGIWIRLWRRNIPEFAA
jgi:hypothetical protein